MPRIEINGGTVEVLDHGEGEPVVALHCSGSSGAQWRALAAKLGAQRRLLAPDLVGYGGSSPWQGRGAFGLADEAEAAGSLLGGLGGPAHLVGHSYGGAVALHLARTRPELLASLTLIEPTAFQLLRTGDPADRAALDEIVAVAGELKEALAAGDYRGGYGRFVDFWSGPGSWAGMPAHKQAAFAPRLAKVVLDFHAIFSDPSGPEALGGVALPILLLQGAGTVPASRRICARLRAALPGAAFAIIDGAGHMLPITHRDEVDRHIVAHIEANAVQTRRPRWKACSPQGTTVTPGA
jgi:pimeloyl-ACP methyl ester carboxylesterase